MTTRRLTLLTSIIALATVASAEDAFVGAYGLTIEHDGDYISAEMRGPVEVIRCASGVVKDPRSGEFRRRPAVSSSAFVTSNYEPLELAEVLVIPRDAPGGYSSLASMREAKEQELVRSGAKFKITAANAAEYPEGSFDVVINSPFGMLQTYTQSREHFFVVTTGRGLSALAGRVRNSVSRHVLKFLPPSPPPLQSDLRMLMGWDFIGIGGWVRIMIASCLLACLPLLSRHRIALRLAVIGRSTIIWTTAFILYAVATQSALRTAGFAPEGDLVALFPALAAPWLFPWLADRVGGKYESRLWRYLLFALALLFFADALHVQSARVPGSNVDTRAEMMDAWIFALAAGLLHGISFGMAYRPGKGTD